MRCRTGGLCGAWRWRPTEASRHQRSGAGVGRGCRRRIRGRVRRRVGRLPAGAAVQIRRTVAVVRAGRRTARPGVVGCVVVALGVGDADGSPRRPRRRRRRRGARRSSPPSGRSGASRSLRRRELPVWGPAAPAGHPRSSSSPCVRNVGNWLRGGRRRSVAFSCRGGGSGTVRGGYVSERAQPGAHGNRLNQWAARPAPTRHQSEGTRGEELGDFALFLRVADLRTEVLVDLGEVLGRRGVEEPAAGRLGHGRKGLRVRWHGQRLRAGRHRSGPGPSPPPCRGRSCRSACRAAAARSAACTN